MNVVVGGGRHLKDRALVFTGLDAEHARDPITRLCHGACGWDGDEPDKHTVENLRGADRWAHEWALEHGLTPVAYPAFWTQFGASGGPRRTSAMLRAERPDKVIAFPGDKGTLNMIKTAKAMGLKVDEIAKF